MMMHKLLLALSSLAVVRAGKYGDLSNPDDQHIELVEDERIEGKAIERQRCEALTWERSFAITQTMHYLCTYIVIFGNRV